MCGRIQTQTKVAAAICLVLTLMAIAEELHRAENSEGINKVYSRGYDYAPPKAKVPSYLYMVFCTVSDVLCLIGAHLNQKYFLLPFIVKTSLNILILVLYLIFMIYVATLVVRDPPLIFHLWITLLFGGLGLYIYCLVTSIRCFREMSAVTSRWSEGIVLQQISISSQPIARNTEVGNCHLYSGDQNQTYGCQEQPPAYQSKDYAKRNDRTKSDYSSNQV